MKILFVCMQYIHSARWINQLKDSGHDIYVFDCLDKPIHEDLKWTNYTENWSKRKFPKLRGEYRLKKKYPYIYDIVEPYIKVTASEKLQEFIMEIQPDLVHSLEMQSETYPLLKVRKKINFKWAYSCWGNDIFFYKDFVHHYKIIKKCLMLIDYNFLECKRDEKLILEINPLSTIVSTEFPGGGGYRLENSETNKDIKDKKKLIVIKGYHHNFGRALHVLKALLLISEKLENYEIYVYSAHNIVVQEIHKIKESNCLSINYSSRYNQISHSELLKKFGEAKIAIGNNISDGIPNTLLESILCGAFPIQSNPGGASEDFINDGINGLLINNPEDPVEIAKLIERAVDDNDLINSAAKINKQLSKKIDYEIIQQKVLKAYSNIEKEL